LAWISDPDEDDESGFTTHGRLRLFSIGYSSSVTEWDLLTGLPRQQSNGSQSEVWCLAAQPRLAPGKKTAKEGEYTGQDLIAGCADGTLIQLTTADDGLLFKKFIARASKKNARALSITFQSRDVVVAGFADSTIRVYDIRNGNLLRTMTLGGGGPRGAPKETLVWALETLKDGSIVSGDSNGEVCFWDASTYAQLQRVQAHEADTLCLASSEDGQTVFSGSIDRRTVMYKKIGGEGERKRWAPVTQRRFHKHDVKAMARFENSKISLIVSGGLDTNPVIVPLREFGKEYHRALSYLPQVPQVASAQRLVVSWWQNEVTVWRLNRRKAPEADFVYPEEEANYNTMARLALKGEEHISSAAISSSGKLLAVATVAETKLFALQPRKQPNGQGLKIEKVSIPVSLADKTGARLVQFSADGRWLLLVNPNNRVQILPLARGVGETNVLPALIPLHRIDRKAAKQNCLNGPWGSYSRTITRAAFSADSRILAVSDLAGHIDTWVLEGHEDSTAPAIDSAAAPPAPNGTPGDDSDDEESYHHHVVVHGQHWTTCPSGALLPTLSSPALVLSFRPTKTPTTPQPNGNPGIHPTRSNPHAHSHALPIDTEDRLIVLTASHELLELHVLEGRLTPWSRRNPSTCLPEEFHLQRDRAVGCLWDVTGPSENNSPRERLWLYSSSWLCMFDLAQDLPSREDPPPPLTTPSAATEPSTNNQARKRKRALTAAAELTEQLRSKRATTGAGSRIPDAELGGGLGARTFKAYTNPVGTSDNDDDDAPVAREIEFAGFDDTTGAEDDDDDEDDSDDDDSDDDDDVDAMDLDVVGPDAHAHALHRFRRDGDEDSSGLPTAAAAGKPVPAKRPPFYMTNRYRPILGVVALGDDDDEHDDEEGFETQTQGKKHSGLGGAIEVALVERPVWDLELPPRFHGGKEYGR